MNTSPVPETYARLSELAWKEKELINHRVTWLLTSQSVLAAAFGLVSVEVAKITPTGDKPALLLTIEKALPLVGSALSFGFLLAVVAAIAAHVYWQRRIDELRIDRAEEWQYPLFQRRGVMRWATAGLAHFASGAVPVAFIWLWAYLWVHMPKP